MASPSPNLTLRWRCGVLSSTLLLAVAEGWAAPPAAPSDITFTSPARAAATISWVDNSPDEDGFQVQYQFPGGSWLVLGTVGADVTSQAITSGFVAEQPILFRVRAGKNGDPSIEWSEFSDVASVTTQNYHIQASCITLTPGQDFSHAVTTNFGVVPTLLSTLPASMTWDPMAGTLSGTAVPMGTYPLQFEATSGSHTRRRMFYVQAINEAPTVDQPPADVEIVAQAGTTPAQSVDLSMAFDDPDIARAAVIDTPAGPIPVGFYAGAPLTVANFFAYADPDSWDGSFFHRSATLSSGDFEPFVIQGGGYAPDGMGDFTAIPDLAPVDNEFDPSRPNICGTIAMAKLGGDPDSATNEFFFSLRDNRAILDGQNGGFTVFGRATDMAAVDAIAAYRTDSYDITLDGVPRSFDDWPLSSYGEDSPLPSQLASITDVREIDPLSWTATSSVPGVATVNGAGGDTATALEITPTGVPGQSEIVVTGTDLDGATVTSSFMVTVSSSYAAWIAVQNIAPKPEGPLDNPGGGPLNNLQSYAFGGDTDDPVDDASRAPSIVSVEIDGTGHDAFCFYHRKYVSDLDYKIESSTDLETWTTLWETADGHGDAAVAAVEDDGEYWKLTLRRPGAAALDSVVFFRVLLTHPTGD